MKKIKYIFIILLSLTLTGCFNNNSMTHIKITTSVYPIEYVVNELYSTHSKVTSLYPSNTDISEFEVTDTLLNQYSDTDLFIFNGLTDEKNYVKTMKNNNKDLKIIDITYNVNYENSIEELWLDPNKLLTIAYNIKEGFNEYIDSKYLLNEIDEKYQELKINLTTLDGKFYTAAKNSETPYIIVTNNAFKYLEKYNINVISLDPDTVTSKDIETAKSLLEKETCKYIYITYGEVLTDEINDIVDETDAITLELYSFTNLNNIDVDKNNYITLMNQNFENIKLELYK